ncbi:ribosomal RNA small subunit methyltransferase A [Clostridia bacterium]|nr:ribosomal RNA small subunit methyltransferase A [Clostridia bacterium]
MKVNHNSARSKSLGQNFLTDAALLDSLAAASGVTAADAVLEIGAGLGGLTAALARRARSVLAVEIDDSLEPSLRESLSTCNNVEILIADGMKLDWAQWMRSVKPPVRFVSNLPYYITTPLLMRAFRHDPPFAGVACMVQEEVARKLCTMPGSGEYGPLGIWSRVRFTPEIVMDVPAVRFDPPPNVDSCFVVCTALAEPLLVPEDYAQFGRVVDAAFAARRKTLRNNLRSGFALTADQASEALLKAGLPDNARAEDISAEEFVKLMQVLSVT